MSCLTKAELLSLSYFLPIAGGRIIGFIPFLRVLVLGKMQSVSSRIWTRVAESISRENNHYTITRLSLKFFDIRRERHNLSILAFSSAPPSTCGIHHKVLREQTKTNRLPPRQVSSLLTDFVKISPNPPRSSGAWRHSHSLAPVSHLGLLWHLWVTCPLCACAWTPK